ncbi:cupin [Mucilaginibacter mali]|uniref:Cupin n=1 Tax=Mucilaginibacter mali TaxID=2740462 RepID=A0A7D4PWZ4_9SPHI|nr:cupin [Mucilaginibacter mali]QKJ32908.1 cupin [Mucilaginibacter mali]
MEAKTVGIEQIKVQDDGTFPNSRFPALLYKDVLDIPVLFKAAHVKNQFEKNGWSNSWDAGIFEYHHYHSVTHEVLGVYKGQTTLQLGGPNGQKVFIEKADVLVIPAGVAHKNLGDESGVSVVGAYFGGRDYDMNYGRPGERPATDENIKKVPVPANDPVYGRDKGLFKIWK